MKIKKFQIVTMLSIILVLILSYFLYDNYNKSKRIDELTQQVKILQPKYTAKDTTEILKLILNVKEFDSDTKIFDTSSAILIEKYPYITNEYKLEKFGRHVHFKNTSRISCSNNHLIFDIFDLLPNDSAYIFFTFHDSQGGQYFFKKVKGKWVIREYGIGKI